MQKFAGSIATYDSIMDEAPEQSRTPEDVLTLLDEGRLPRVRTAEIDTGTLGLRVLFNYLGFPVSTEPFGAFQADWSKLAELAKSGELIDTWFQLKSKPFDPVLVDKSLSQFYGSDHILIKHRH